jgi:DNA-binding CsgD family transcriptional regulator
LGDQKNNTPTLSLKATYDLISEAKNLRRRVSETIKGAEEYPEEFSQQARARIEAERLKARKQLEQRRNQVPWSGGHLPRPADEENLRKFILRVFLVVAQEMCELGLQGLWTVDRIRPEAEEYLRKFMIKAFSDEGYDKQGRKLPEMTDYYGSIKEEVWWAFKNSAEYHQFEQKLLAVAEQQARRSPQASGKAEATEAATEPPKEESKKHWPKEFGGLPKKPETEAERLIDAARLTDKQHTCALLRWIYNLPVAEIARRIGKDRGTAYKHLKMAEIKMETHKDKIRKGRGINTPPEGPPR